MKWTKNCVSRQQPPAVGLRDLLIIQSVFEKVMGLLLLKVQAGQFCENWETISQNALMPVMFLGGR
jgi:hypothetical protein